VIPQTLSLPPALGLKRERTEGRKREKFYIYLDVTHTHIYIWIYMVSLGKSSTLGCGFPTSERTEKQLPIWGRGAERYFEVQMMGLKSPWLPIVA